LEKFIEVRWHGRGGQGAKTAAMLLAEAASDAGLYIQAFPEYGPERMGAPVLAFNRISSKPIRLHCHVNEPDIVVVLDPTLIGKVDVANGLSEDGVLLVNTDLPPAEIRKQLKLEGKKVFTVDASRISMETIGRPIPNTPMMGALIKVTGILPFEAFMEVTKVQLEEKFRTKPEVIKGNLEAIERAYQEVENA
jgi:pyruvate ferredoxin oxidoreductase gamma subunit